MDVETHEILFSFDHPMNALPSLLTTVQQLLAQLKTRSGKSIPLFEGHRVLIIDLEGERSAYLVQALSLAGYRTLAVSSALEAFTLYLQGTFVPLLTIVGQDDPARRFFLQRLAQQMLQRYDVEMPQIRLTTQISSFSGTLPRVSPLQQDPAAPLSSANFPPLPDSIHSSRREGNSYSQNTPLPPTLPRALRSRPLRSLQQNQPSSAPISHSNLLPPQSPSSGSEWHVPYPEKAPFDLNDAQKNELSFPVSTDAYSFSENMSSSTTEPHFLPSSQSSYTPPPMPSYPEPLIPPQVQSLAPSTVPLQPPPAKQVRISLEGQSLGRYQVELVLGKGPIGDVYQVYDRLRETRVALKAIQTDTVSFGTNLAVEEEHMFQRESTLMSRLKHSHLAPVLNIGKSYISGSSFIYKTMPLYTESTLSQWFYEHGGQKPRSPQELLPVILQLADVLQFAHDQQVPYLNLKPNNIFLKVAAKSISQLDLILADFAIPFDSGSLPFSSDALPYIAPEYWDGSPQPASDQYALAVFTYELLTGKPLFLGTSEQIMRRLHQTRQPQSPSIFNPAVSLQLSNIVLRALAKRPEERFASVGVFAQMVQRASF